jgi:hypothetical protein
MVVLVKIDFIWDVMLCVITKPPPSHFSVDELGKKLKLFYKEI